ncbi:hypothetical protein SASPL_125961 [Salvia splendens]|uniref:Uncharacterized protein n=1 Tax=Salvia splendens TaxID=180675 RepID=A0A8X8XJW5_SALSN|nr:hypothetical protein SASPL_125961 [Salvia splendens]
MQSCENAKLFELIEYEIDFRDGEGRRARKKEARKLECLAEFQALSAQSFWGWNAGRDIGFSYNLIVVVPDYVVVIFGAAVSHVIGRFKLMPLLMEALALWHRRQILRLARVNLIM